MSQCQQLTELLEKERTANQILQQQYTALLQQREEERRQFMAEITNLKE